MAASGRKGTGSTSAGGTAQSKDARARRARARHAPVASARRSGAGRGWWIGGGVLIVVFAAVAAIGVARSAPTGPPPTMQDPNPAVLAPATTQSGGPVDGVASSSSEQVLFHIHAHLQIYVNGTQKLVPYGIGIVGPYQLAPSQDGPFVTGGKAFYWLHTHDETGVIHIESPLRRAFTLGNVFDLWGQPLTGGQVGPATGPVTAFVNGQPVTGHPRDIPLDAHAVIQLDVGGPTVAPQPYTFAANL